MLNKCKKRFNDRSSNLIYIITSDETCIYSYEPETEDQSAVWIFQNEPKPTKKVINENKSAGQNWQERIDL